MTYSFTLAATKANYVMAKTVVDFLSYAGSDAPHETIQAACGDLSAILEDNENLLRDAFDYSPVSLQSSRLPKREEKPLTPKEALDLLDMNLNLMEIEVKALLRKSWATDIEYRQISKRRDHVIKMMGYFSRYYKAVISQRDPSVWTSDIEKRFEKFLKIKP